MWIRPLKTYTKREMAYALRCSTKTIDTDCGHLGITPQKGDRGLNLYSERDFTLIVQLRQHCSNPQNSRDSFVPITVPQVVEDEPKIIKLNSEAESHNNNNLSFFLDRQKEIDPFFDLELLQRISDNKWLLPAKRLAPILGISPKYLNQRSMYIYCGFMAKREILAHNKVLWKVEANNN